MRAKESRCHKVKHSLPHLLSGPQTEMQPKKKGAKKKEKKRKKNMNIKNFLEKKGTSL